MLDWKKNVGIRRTTNSSHVQYGQISVLTKDTLNCPDDDEDDDDQAPPLIEQNNDESSDAEMDIVDDYNMAMNDGERITEDTPAKQRSIPVNGGPFASERVHPIGANDRKPSPR